MGFPGGSAAKNPPALLETQFLSLSWEGPCRRTWQPTPVSLPGESHGQRSLAGYSPWGLRVRQDWSNGAWHTTLFVQSDLYHFKMFISILQYALMILFLNSEYVLYLLSMQVNLWPCDFIVTGNDGIILQTTASVRKQTFPLPAWV